MTIEQARGEASSPFVEIAENDAGRRLWRVAGDHFEQPVCLVASLEEARAEVDVEKLQNVLRIRELDVDFETTTRLVAATTQIVIVIADDGQLAENSVAVRCAVKPAVLTNAEVHFQLFRKRTDLVPFARDFVHADDFLQRDDVSVYLFQHFGYTLRPYATIESTALVNVVSCDTKR